MFSSGVFTLSVTIDNFTFYRACKMLPAVTPETFSAIMRKAKSLFFCQKYEEALDVIILIQEDIDNFTNLNGKMLMIFFNNVGVLYYFLRKLNLSTFYLNKAREVYLFNVFRRSPRDSIEVFHSDTIYKIMYNTGLCMLFKKKPIEAFNFFRNAAQGMHQSPLVWLRLAECCMMAYKKDNEGLFSFFQKRNSLANGKIGSGLVSKIVLNSKLYKDSAFSCVPEVYCDRAPSLGFANICLKNSYLLLPAGNSKLKQAILAASCYVHLTIGSPIKAYKYARMLFTEASLHVYKYLSNLYIAESLITLNQIQQAIDLLKPSQFNDWDSLNEQNCFSNVHITSEAILNYNLAVALTMNREFQKASELLRNVWRFRGARCEVPIHVVALALYIELVLGHVDAAKIIIKHNCPQLF